MTRTGRILSWTGGILLGLVLLLAATIVFFPWNSLRGWATNSLGERLGREVRLAGDIDVDLGWTTRVTLHDVTLSNADWGSEPDMFTAERLDLALRIPELLRGRMVLPLLSFTKPKLLLEKNKQGDGNWQFESVGGAAAKAAAPEDRTEVPIIERLVIDQGRVAYKDPGAKVDIDSQVSTATGDAGGDEKLKLTGTGTLEGKPARLSIDGASILSLRDPDDPYPLRVEASVGDTRVLAEGTVLEPLQMKGFDLRLDLRGPDMAALFPLFGVPMPNTRPYSLAGQLQRKEGEWTVKDFKGRVGGSDLAGDATLATGEPRPKFTARLVSQRLDITDLAGLVGGQPGEEDETKSPDRVLPATPIKVDRLRETDLDVSFAGKRVLATALPIDDLKFRLAVDNGRARLDPVSFGVASGDIAGRVQVDARRKLPAAEIDLQLRQLQLADFFKGGEMAQQMGGTIGGRIELKGEGASTADILAVADGRVALFMGEGKLSNLVIELAGIDLAEAIGIVMTKDKPVGLRCAVADMAVEQGVMRSRNLVIDTTDTLVSGEGSLNLGNERLALSLLAHPKDPSPLAARTPITVQGTLKSPKIGVDPTGAVARAGAAVALGALLTPLAALLPFIELGLGEDSPCAAMIQQARQGQSGDEQSAGSTN